MRVIDSDSHLRLSGELSEQEHRLLLTQQRSDDPACALAAEDEQIADEFAASEVATQAQRPQSQGSPARAPSSVPPPLKRSATATLVAPPLAPASEAPAPVATRALATASEVSTGDSSPLDEAPVVRGWLLRLLCGRLRAVPSWLVSLVVHLIAFIVLALLTLPTIIQAERELLVISTTPNAPVLESLDLMKLEPQLEDVQTETFDAPAAITLESTALDDAAAGFDGPGSYVNTDVDAIDVGELGELFGENGHAMASVAGTGRSAEFFGVKSGGRRFVFIVDSSNSMRGRKFEDAKQELVYAVRRLDKSQMFYVIFFDQDAARMFSGNGQDPEPRPVFATMENIRKLEAWLPTVKLELRTDPYDAVKFAHDLRPDAIFILSDGQFTDRGKTERFLADHNIIDDPALGRRPKVVINTIAFYSQQGEVTMKQIAEAYQGTYRFVPPPARMKKK
jgi:hypothetical protein